MSVVQSYAPTNVAEVEVKEAFYSCLTKVMSEINKGDIVILMGDMNAQVGHHNKGLEATMGRHGLGIKTENGEMFTEICANFNLVIGETLFNHKRVHKITWTSPDRMTENQIDHIAISRKWRGSLMDKRGADIDHHLLIASVRLEVAAVSDLKKKIQKKFHVEKLKDASTCARFIESLNASGETEYTLTSDWKSIKQTFLKAAEYCIGFKAYKRKSWISDSTWRLINERREIKNQLNSAKTRSAKAAPQHTYSKTDKLIKKRARTDKRIWSDNLARKAQEAAETYRTLDLY
ncbi:craniofacial development protein 2-like [Bactrocera tryoni]|uniref:craniofacial development protein 2-like n=1 Tax=Bactrocera tryoni TaxID=59916 RepID=UPI001A969CB0|nr:craniofacial development protein 2-like [Bactrocera tryoni]